MDDDQARAAVARFVAHARTRAGSGTKLARVIKPWYGSGHHSTVDAWANGSANAPGWILFTIARELGLSLDEFLLSEEDQRPLGDQLAELRLDVQALQVQVAGLLESGRMTSEGA